jgi:protein-tyrosine-phosphatase
MTLPTIGRLGRALRSLLDRAAHGSRRQKALERLRTTARPRSILVVCQGNLCRSPYAEAVLRRALDSAGLPIGVESAGFSTPNRASPAEAIGAAARRGLDLSAHKSRVVSRVSLDASDLIVVMDPWLRRAVTVRQSERRVLVLGDLDPEPIASREITDPLGGPAAVYSDCYGRIDRCLAELVRTLNEAR